MIGKSLLYKETTNDRLILVLLFFFAFFLLFFCSTTSPLYPANQWSDVNLYFNAGKAMFNGKVLYTEVFDHKGPMIFVIYGLGYLISNDSFFGVFILQCIGWVVMTYCAYYTARLFLDRSYSFIVALVFPTLLLSHTLSGGSAEEFITMFMVVSFYFFIRYFKEEGQQHSPRHMLIHGLMCGLVALIKINLLIFWIFPLLVILIDLIGQKDYRNLFSNIVAYLLGVSVIVLPMIAYLWLNDALSEAFDVYIGLNKKYSAVTNLGEVVGYLTIRFYQRFRFDRLEFLFIVIGGLYFPFRYLKHKLGRVGFLMSFFTLYFIIYMGVYMYYYSIPTYIFVIPGAIVVAGFVRKFVAIKCVWHILACFAFATVFFAAERKNYFGYDADQLLKGAKVESLENKFCPIIDKEPNPTLLNLGLDLGNAVFTYSNIVPTVKYFISPNLTYEAYPDMRNEQTKYIENKEVQFVILSQASFNYDYFIDLPALRNNYTIVAQYIEDFDRMYYLFKRND